MVVYTKTNKERNKWLKKLSFGLSGQLTKSRVIEGRGTKRGTGPRTVVVPSSQTGFRQVLGMSALRVGWVFFCESRCSSVTHYQNNIENS